MTCSIQEWQLLLSYFWSCIPFCLNLISCPLCNTNTLQILMIFGKNVEQDEMRCCEQERQLWLSYFWSYLPFLFWIWFPVCSVSPKHFGLCILILLCINVEHDEMACCVQEWQLWLSHFWSYLPFLCLNLILCPLWEYPSQYFDDTW